MNETLYRLVANLQYVIRRGDSVDIGGGSFNNDALKDLLNALKQRELLLAEAKKQVTWLNHIKNRIDAPVSIFLGFDQSLEALQKAINYKGLS